MNSEELLLTFHSNERGVEAHLSGYGEAAKQIDEQRLRDSIPDLIQGWDGPLRSLQEDELRDLGESLFETIFDGDLLNIFSSSRPGARPSGARRLRLRIQIDPEQDCQWLSRVPWEAMFWPQGGVYLGLDRRFSIVRSLPVPLEPMRWTPSEFIRCLIVPGHPGANPSSGQPVIDLESEIRWIRQGVESNPRLRLQEGVDAEPTRLRSELLRSQGQVLHFMGHGFRERRAGRLEFGLLLKDGEGGPQRITADQFSDLVLGTSARLVVLNACSSAQERSSGFHEPFHGVAQRLIRKGIPAVVALRHPIRDRSARIFSRIFYACLGRGDDLDSAVTEARIVMKREVSDVNDWLVPSLFLRSKESRLFPRSPKQPVEPDVPKPLPPKPPVTSIRIGKAKVAGTMETVGVHRKRTGGANPTEQATDTVNIEVEEAEARDMKNVGLLDEIHDDEGS